MKTKKKSMFALNALTGLILLVGGALPSQQASAAAMDVDVVALDSAGGCDNAVYYVCTFNLGCLVIPYYDPNGKNCDYPVP